MQQAKKPFRTRFQLLLRLTLNAGKHPGNQPARLAQLDDGNDCAILVQGDEGPAQVVQLGHRGTPSVICQRRWCHLLRRLPHTISLLEGDGFEPSVPRQKDNAFRDSSFPTCARATAAFENARRPVQQLLLPVVDPVRMNAELTRQLGDRPVPPTAATTTPSL